MNAQYAELNSMAAWKQAQADRQESPLHEVFSKIRQVLAWQDAPDGWHSAARRLNQIQRRFEDPYLKLAVIGDFSCGKSTFLNAVLGQSLLKMALLATTAIPTYIRWDGNRERGVHVTAICQDRSAFDLTGPDREAFEARLGHPFPEALDALIDAVTTDNALAGIVERVELSLPEQENRYGLCLIDTPGVNPGADDTKGHVLETRRVLRQKADCALVLSPAKSLFTDSFLQFLQENAEHFLHDAVFMITQMDRADQDEGAEELKQYAETLLLDLGVESPQVRCISARSALRAACGESLSPGEQQWAQSFERDMQGIFRDLSLRRNDIAARSTSAVLRQLTGDLQKDLSAKKEALEARKTALSRWSPENMKEECRQIVQEHKTALAAALPQWTQEMNDTLDQSIYACRRTVQDRIKLCNSGIVLNHYLSHQAKRDLAALEPPIRGKMEQISQQIRERHTVVCERLVQCLNRYKVFITGQATHQYAIEELNHEKLDLTWAAESAKTATALTALGEMLDGLTDVLGDLGSFSLGEAFSDLFDTLSDLFFNVIEMFTPMKTRRENAITQINGYLNNTRDTLRSKCQSQINNVHLSSCVQADKMPDALERDYAPLFEEKKRAYEVEMAALSDQIRVCSDHLALLQSCEDTLRSVLA